MFAVIPARNEAERLARAVRTVRAAGVEKIVVVVNGCTDDTRDVARSLQDGSLTLLSFSDALGVDIPRAVGAAYAHDKGAEHVLFYDGDLVGPHRDELAFLVESAKRFPVDLALTDCYGTAHSLDIARDPLLRLRRELNRQLGLERRLGLANPAHGPHIVSKRLLKSIPPSYLAKPPLVLSHAAGRGLHIDALVHIPHAKLGSAHKGPDHFNRVRETIIGDLLEALRHARGQTPSREYRGHTFDGYHTERRFDLLARFLQSLTHGKKGSGTPPEPLS